MKIKEIIKETHEDTIENLRNECSQTIDLMNKTNRTIYHSSNYDFGNIKKITPKSGRKPRDMSELFHNLINDCLNEKGIKTNRGNSIFGFKEQKFTYGNFSYILFPVNNSNVLWFKNSIDLFLTMKRYIRTNFDISIIDMSYRNIEHYKNDFNEMLNFFNPQISLEKYFYNNINVEIMISSPVYVVKNEVFKTNDFKKQIGLI